MILAGDIGGTKTLLALFELENNKLIKKKFKRYASKKYKTFDTVMSDFLKDEKTLPRSAAFGIPGPVVNGKVKSTNLPWVIDEHLQSKKTGIPKIKVVNDLAATAFAIPFLKDDELIEIKKGAADRDSERFAVIAPGTGLGEAFLLCEEDKKIVIPSEGGHTDFAPTNKLETELLLYLKEKFNRVSYERIISGSGMPNIFEFLVNCRHKKPSKETLNRMETEDKTVVISEMALKKKDEVCETTLEIFVSVLGTHAGNLVMTTMSTGGVYFGGGIPFKILPKLKEGNLVKSFTGKGRLTNLPGVTPIYVINNNFAALHGAARIAIENSM